LKILKTIRAEEFCICKEDSPSDIVGSTRKRGDELLRKRKRTQHGRKKRDLFGIQAGGRKTRGRGKVLHWGWERKRGKLNNGKKRKNHHSIPLRKSGKDKKRDIIIHPRKRKKEIPTFRVSRGETYHTKESRSEKGGGSNTIENTVLSTYREGNTCFSGKREKGFLGAPKGKKRKKRVSLTPALREHPGGGVGLFTKGMAAVLISESIPVKERRVLRGKRGEIRAGSPCARRGGASNPLAQRGKRLLYHEEH